MTINTIQIIANDYLVWENDLIKYISFKDFYFNNKIVLDFQLVTHASREFHIALLVSRHTFPLSSEVTVRQYCL